MSEPERTYDGLTFVFDVDGTICPIKGPDERYEDLVPYAEVVARMREYHDGGARIIINSSRNMRTYDGNVGLINRHTAPVMLAWLEKWGIPYDEIVFAKPWPGRLGFYVDDRTIRPDEFLRLTPEQMGEACRASREELR